MSYNFDDALKALKLATKTTTNKELAESLGIAPNTIQNWRLRSKIPDHVYEKVNVTSSVSGHGIRLYDVTASAGVGALVEYEPHREVELGETLKLVLGITNPKQSSMLYMQGDSMVPTLSDGSLIAIETMESFANDGIYVFSWENELFIKRLQRTKDGVRVISDNEKYEAWEISREEMQNRPFTIHGRVTGCCQRL